MSTTGLRIADRFASMDMHGMLKEEQEKMAAASGGAAAAQAPANMLAGNFVSATSEPSRYITARISGLRDEQASDNKLDMLLASMPILQGGGRGGKSYVERYLDGLKAQRQLRRIVDQEVAAQNIETLENAREELERKAQDALTPEGSGSAPTQGDATGGEGATASAQAVDATQAAPVAVDAAATAPAVVDAAAVAPAAPVVASVDVVV